MEMTRDENVLRVGFQSCDIPTYWRFGMWAFCLTRFGLELIIFFWTSSQLSAQFWDCKLLYW